MVQDTNLTQTGGHTTLHDARPTDARHYTTQDRRIHDTTRHKTDAYTTLNDTKPTDTDTKSHYVKKTPELYGKMLP